MKNNRKRFFANDFQKKILRLVFLSSVVPSVIAAVSLFYLIFNVIANELVFPEAIAYTLIPAAKKVAVTIFLFVPVSLALFFWWAWHVSHKLVGPLGRLSKELENRLDGKTKGHINFRKGDYLSSLAEKINHLIDKAQK